MRSVGWTIKKPLSVVFMFLADKSETSTQCVESPIIRPEDSLTAAPSTDYDRSILLSGSIVGAGARYGREK